MSYPQNHRHHHIDGIQSSSNHDTKEEDNLTHRYDSTTNEENTMPHTTSAYRILFNTDMRSEMHHNDVLVGDQTNQQQSNAKDASRMRAVGTDHAEPNDAGNSVETNDRDDDIDDDDQRSGNRNEDSGQNIMENDDIQYKDQMQNARSPRRKLQQQVKQRQQKQQHQQLVNPSVTAVPTRNRNANLNNDNNDSGDDNVVIRRRLNISELVVHYGTGGRDDDVAHENNDSYMDDNDELVVDSTDKSILPLAAEVIDTPPLAVATPVRYFTKKQTVILLSFATIIIVIAVVMSIVLSIRASASSNTATTPTPTSSDVPTYSPTGRREAFSDEHVLTSAVDVYYSSGDPSNIAQYGKIEYWNISNVTSLDDVFSYNRNLCLYSFDADITRWDTSRVTSMKSTFNSVLHFNQDISQWDTSRVTDMSGMFQDTVSFNVNLSTWNTSSVTNISNMFSYAHLYEGNGMEDWDVSKVVDMSGAFNHAAEFQGDLSNWNTANAKNMSSLFSGCTSYMGIGIDYWDTSSVTDMSGMFQEFSTMSHNDNIYNWDVSNVVTMNSMFKNANFNYAGLDLSKWNVSRVLDMTNMFQGVKSINSNISDWDVSNVIYMNSMFQDSKVYGYFSTWNVSRVLYMTNMFQGANVYALNISDWDVSNVISMNSMFQDASNIDPYSSPSNPTRVVLDVSGWNVSNVLDMTNMFYGATNFTCVGFDKWVLHANVKVDYMFCGFNQSEITTWTYNAQLAFSCPS